MEDRIKHQGTIRSINGGHIRVQIVQTSACSTCSIANHCDAADSKLKIIDIYHVDNFNDYRVGQCVTVSATNKMGAQAVIIAFGIPFLVLVTFLYIFYLITRDETASAIAGIASMSVYYLGVYILRDSLARKFAFRIEKEIE